MDPRGHRRRAGPGSPTRQCPSPLTSHLRLCDAGSNHPYREFATANSTFRPSSRRRFSSDDGRSTEAPLRSATTASHRCACGVLAHASNPWTSSASDRDRVDFGGDLQSSAPRKRRRRCKETRRPRHEKGCSVRRTTTRTVGSRVQIGSLPPKSVPVQIRRRAMSSSGVAKVRQCWHPLFPRRTAVA